MGGHRLGPVPGGPAGGGAGPGAGTTGGQAPAKCPRRRWGSWRLHLGPPGWPVWRSSELCSGSLWGQHIWGQPHHGIGGPPADQDFLSLCQKIPPESLPSSLSSCGQERASGSHRRSKADGFVGCGRRQGRGVPAEKAVSWQRACAAPRGSPVAQRKRTRHMSRRTGDVCWRRGGEWVR